MKALLVGEYRDGKLLGSIYELVAFSQRLGVEPTVFLVGNEEQLPKIDGKVYLADAKIYGEFNPDVHKRLLLEVVKKESPDIVVFAHSSYGWDLAPRAAFALNAAQISEVIEVVEGAYVVPFCNAKLRRQLRSNTRLTIITVQAGAFSPKENPSGSPMVEKVEVEVDVDATRIEFAGYEAGEKGSVDLTKAEIIVGAGRGVGKKDNLEILIQLAKVLGGELGASRPVVDAEWVDHSRQIGTTGQTVAPKLYIACGISGAIQHLAGMKRSDFVVAINKDKDAPISEVADVMVVADLLEFVPALTAKLQK